MLPAQPASSETDGSPSADSSPLPAPPKPEEGRILGVIPGNKIVPKSQPGQQPLSVRAKFLLATRDTIDPGTFVLAAFYAGVGQWQNDYPGYGLGAQGYGKRIGASYADQAIGNYLTEAIVPSLTREDPRYFRKGRGRGWSRIGYAMSRTIITRTDRGKSTFNISEFLGNGIAAGISTAYYPAEDRNALEAGEKLGIQIASDSAFNVLLEFWPDMRRAIFKR